ncbi:MAG: hypothetical protein ACFBSE_17160 [Prochloraceae cyanobacterium]
MFFYDIFFIVINHFRRNERFYNIASGLFLIASILSFLPFLFDLLNNSLEPKYLFSGIIYFLLAYTMFFRLINLYGLIFGIYLFVINLPDLITLAPQFSSLDDLLQGEKSALDRFFSAVFLLILNIYIIVYSLYVLIEKNRLHNLR